MGPVLLSLLLWPPEVSEIVGVRAAEAAAAEKGRARGSMLCACLLGS